MVVMLVKRIYKALIFSSLISLGLLLVRIFRYQDLDYWFLAWNLFLAWIPLFFAVTLVSSLERHLWLSWQCLLLTFLWLVFLPNSFYLATDFIHLQNASTLTLLYDVALILSYTLNGFLIGYLSVIAIHDQLNKRIKASYSNGLVAGVLLLCSFAIYLGRYLRWNTWDILLNPAGLLFDVSDRIINPNSYQQTYTTTILFFVVIASFYYVAWQIYSGLKQQPVNNKKLQAKTAKSKKA